MILYLHAVAILSMFIFLLGATIACLDEKISDIGKTPTWPILVTLGWVSFLTSSFFIHNV